MLRQPSPSTPPRIKGTDWSNVTVTTETGVARGLMRAFGIRENVALAVPVLAKSVPTVTVYGAELGLVFPALSLATALKA